MTAWSVAAAAAALLQAADAPRAPGACVADSAAPRLDHVVLVVRDLDSAAAGFLERGFRLKAGRLHPNGLLNRHVKFRDGTSLELMTVRGRPGDAMAHDYVDLLAAGEGGVYVAFTTRSIDDVARAATSARLESKRSASGSWRFLSFPSGSPAAAVFFGSGTFAVRDPDSLVTHVPDVAGLTEAWVEGGSALGGMLEALGARSCGPVRSADGTTGERWALGKGALVVVPARAGVRPRVLGVVLARREPGEDLVRPHDAFWVRYRHDTR